MIELEKAGTGEVLIIGHRGAMGYAPENTFASFERAVDLGVDLIELDIHLSSDGEPVVVHDATVDRTSDGTGRVLDMSLAELKRLDFGSSFDRRFAGECMPALREVLEWAGDRVPLTIEIKGDPLPATGIEEKLVGLLREYDMVDRVMAISFHHPAVRRIKEIEPRLATGILYAAHLADSVGAARAAMADSLRPSWSYWTRELVRDVHAGGLNASTWTVNEPELALTLAEMGVDSIATNFPDRIMNALKSKYPEKLRRGPQAEETKEDAGA